MQASPEPVTRTPSTVLAAKGKTRVGSALQTPEEKIDAPALLPVAVAPTLEALFRLALEGREPSPLQLAICRLTGGAPLDGCITDAEALEWFGCPLATLQALEGAPPESVCLVAGVRGGKSKLAACAAVLGALTADVSGVPAAEEVWYPVLAPRGRTARATFVQVLGLLAHPSLAPLVVGKPLAESVTLRRPRDGRLVQVVVSAASAGGLTVRARWLAGYCLDELAQFGREASGAVVNVEELQRAADTRVLPGGQGWLVSSPYGPQGLLYETWSAHFGRPGRVLVVWAPTRALNPTFPQSKVDALAARDPDTAAREYGARWTDPETQWYPSPWVDACTRAAPVDLEREDGVTYSATMDPATRGNAWTLTVGGKRWRDRRQISTVVAAREWIGSRKEPLDPKRVLREIKELLAVYGVDMVETDQWSSDALRSIAGDMGLFVMERRIGADRFDLYDSLRTMLGAGDVELPPVEAVRSDLLGVRRRLTSAGVAVHLPKTADGRHCDFAPALVLLLARPMADPAPQPGAWSAGEIAEQEIAQLQQRRIDAIEAEGDKSWWERD